MGVSSAVKDLFHRYVDGHISRVDDVDRPGANDLEKTLTESDARALHKLVISMLDN